MRTDKLTTKFQQALSDAQSVACGQGNQFIEPQHLLLAMLNQDDGAVASLLARCKRWGVHLRRRLKQHEPRGAGHVFARLYFG